MLTESTVEDPLQVADNATFSKEERAAMRARAKELKANQDGLTALQAKIAEMPDHDRHIAERLHELITTAVPALTPKTWYGMPAYVNKNGKIVCFFQAASKFGVRYATLGFNEAATLDEGCMWATSFALLELGATEETRITELVKQAAKSY